MGKQMDNQQARQVQEAARTFAEAIRESLRITSARSEEARERANQLTRNFFESVMVELQAEAARNRDASQQLVDQSRKQQQAFRQMSEESLALYRNFLGSVSSYYQSNVERARDNVREGVQAATSSAERLATSARSAAEGHPGVPIEGYDELNVEEVTARLDDLSEDELHRTLEYEAQNKNRQTVLNRIEQKLT